MKIGAPVKGRWNTVGTTDSTAPLISKLPLRCIRLAIALCQRPLSREAADQLASASNSPHYIGILRKRLGLDLPCERVPFVTRDGLSSHYGRYHATEKDKRIIRTFLEQGGLAGA